MDQNLSLAKTYLDMLEGWKKGKSKRESWVPEAIADEDVADFMGAAAAAAKAGKKEFKFGDKTYKVTMKKSTVDAINDEANLCEKCGKVHEGSCNEEVQEASIQLVAKDLEAYAKKSGGIDKKDFMKAADMMKSNQKAALVKFVDNLDTEPRDKIISMVAQMMGRKTAEKMFSVKIREENEELDENNSDKYMWKDINAALMKAGMNPPQIMKVLSGLKGKAIKEETVEEAKKAKGKPLSQKQIKRALQSVKAQPKNKVSLKKAPWDESLDESPEEPRAKGEKDFKKMHDDNVEVTDEKDGEDETFDNIKKSADSIKK